MSKRKELVVKLDDQEVTIKKLAILEYSELFLALQELPKKIENLDKMDQDTILQDLPYLLSVALPEVLKIVAQATKLDLKYIETLGLDEVTDLVSAVLEVNNFDKIVNNIKKMRVRKPDQPKLEQKIG